MRLAGFAVAIVAVTVLVACCAQPSYAIPQNVTIYTKPTAPMVYRESATSATGFSIDLVNEMIRRLWGSSTVDVFIKVVSNNEEIFNSVTSAPATADTFALGISAITITSEREDRFNFLPTYFESGLQVLAHTSNDFGDVANRLLSNFFTMIGFYILVTLVIMSVLAPIAFFFELMYPDEPSHVPIFVDFDNERASWTKWQKMGHDLLLCVMWATSTLLGTRTAYPKSKYARMVHSLLKAVGALLKVTLIAAMTVVFSVSTASTDINGFSDLGKGDTVCTAIGSTSESYLKANQNGFHINALATSSAMIEAFYDGKCDACVYDFPLLKESLRNHPGQAHVVGDVFSPERYGAMVRTGNPYEQDLKKVTIAITTDHDFMTTLENRWFKAKNLGSDDTVSAPVALKVVPAFLGIGVMIFLGVFMVQEYEVKEKQYIKNHAADHDDDFEDDLKRLRAHRLGQDIANDVDWIIWESLYRHTNKLLRISMQDQIKAAKNHVQDSHEAPEEKTTELVTRQRSSSGDNHV